jgi:hypothetical protein
VEEPFGPRKTWILQFSVRLYYVSFDHILNLKITSSFYSSMQPDHMVEEPNEYTVARHLEAYLLWLFGWTMFCTTQGNAVAKSLITYAQRIADAPLGAVPQFSWASAVLASMYRGLCDACTRTNSQALLAGCPLLLQLWSYTRFSIARPQIDFSAFSDDF